jgi:hypothetical protein
MRWMVGRCLAFSRIERKFRKCKITMSIAAILITIRFSKYGDQCLESFVAGIIQVIHSS